MEISVVVPFHWMKNWQFFLNRCLASIEKQSFDDYEVILMKVGTMPETSNRVIEAAKGKYVKILYMDDYLAYPNALREIADNMTGAWMATGCLHDDGGGPKNYHSPSWNDRLYTGVNSIGSPSVLTMKREAALLFDVNLSWLLDCDLYQRLYGAYGSPTLLDTPNVVIGLHSGQTSHIMSDEEKSKEQQYILKKYAV